MAEQKIGIIVDVKNRSSRAFAGIEKNLKKVSKRTEDWNKKFEKTFDSLKKGGTILTGLGVGLGFVAKGWIDVAADAEETQSKFNVVFKGMDEEMNQWAGNFADKVGRSNKEIKKFSSGMADVLKPMGLTTKEASKMSKEMTALALDVASFNNKQDADVINSFTAALTGERESLKSLGIVISEADVKNEAYRLGITKQGEELNKTTKAQATMSLIFANTSDAQGDLQRTGDSYTNSLKSMTSSMENFSSELGNELLPIVTPIIQGFTTMIKRFSELSPGVKSLTAKIVLATAAFALIGGPILLFIGFLPQIAAGLTMVSGAFGVLKVAIMSLMSPVGLAIAVVGAFYLAVDNNLLGIKDLFESWGAWLYEKMGIYVTHIGLLSTAFFEVWQSLIETKDGIIAMFEEFGAWLFTTLDSWNTSVSEKMAIISLTWKTTWQGMKDFFQKIVNSIVDIFQKALDKIKGLIKKIIEASKKVKKKLTGIGSSLGAKIYDVTHPSERAFGGVVPSGKPVLVGERGPEIVTFPHTGKVTPNNQLGGGSNVTVNLNFSGNNFENENQFRRYIQIAKEQFIQELEINAIGSY